MCFLFTDPDLIIDEPQLQSANLNTDKGGDTLSENEASPTRRRYEPRDLKDLTGHTFGTIPPDFKPVLTIPRTERPDQGISELPADLTIIERFTTVTHSEQSITTSSPRRLNPGTEIEIITIVDGTKFIPPSSTSDVTSPSQGPEHTSPKETTTEVLSLSTETTLFAPSSDRPSEASSWTTSYTTDSNTELLPPSSSPPASGTSALSETTRIIVGVFAGVFALLVAIFVFCVARWYVKGPKSRHREQHELQPEPRHRPRYEPRHELQNVPQYGQPANVSVQVYHNHAEIQPQQAVADYGWKA
ncbi:hypothetical protein FVEG_15041 [Fusarium verticillioides 7600]|uniref:Mid2 domain-containing protein n=1 Tax=Gibberella moniliformis (strain M3125 / FGSC 7600) TaxID=334819 RepID=W7LVZ5_GIBM7|nr:hypothetical protein FVEG_15041 [Fusarium verticillioides 7600]EWG39594.1 hypothetical protein FVEG_15041 [Fusarium verticillioides 7600]